MPAATPGPGGVGRGPCRPRHSGTRAWIGPKRAAKARSMARSKAREVRIQRARGIARKKSESPPGCGRWAQMGRQAAAGARRALEPEPDRMQGEGTRFERVTRTRKRQGLGLRAAGPAAVTCSVQHAGPASGGQTGRVRQGGCYARVAGALQALQE